MPVSDLDIWRSARSCIVIHGEGAWVHASTRADELMAAGDVEGARTWRRILEAIKSMDASPPAGTRH